MAADDRARLALEKEIVQEKKKEAVIEKTIKELRADGVAESDKTLSNAVKELATQKESTQEAKNKLKAYNKLVSLEKTYAKSLSTSTKLTKDILDTNIQSDAHGKLKAKSEFEQQEVLQSIVDQRNKMIGLSTEQQMLDYDHESTLEAINELLSDTTGMDEGEVEYLKEQLAYNRDIAESLNKQSAATQMSSDAQEGILGALGTSKSAMKGLVAGAKQFLVAILANPILAIGAVLLAAVTLMIKLANAAGDLRDELGVSHVQAAKLMARLGPAHIALKMMGEDSQEVASALLNSFGTVDSLTNETLLAAGNLRREFGGTHEEISTMAKIIHDQLGTSITESINMVSEFGDKFEEAGIAAGSAISDMANNVEFLSEYLDGSLQSMIDATIAARKLGLELGTVAKIADSLLDFETSISNTMQASLLIGKQLNFDRARGLALEGKTEEAVQDIVSQLGGVAEFQRLNVLQRRGLAEALGVGVDELSALIRGSEKGPGRQDELVSTNKNLIEAINKNTEAIKGESASTADKKMDKQLKFSEELHSVFMRMADSTDKVAHYTKRLPE